MENIYPFSKSFSFLNRLDPTRFLTPKCHPWLGGLGISPMVPPRPRVCKSSTANPPLPHARVRAPLWIPLATMPVRPPASAAVVLATYARAPAVLSPKLQRCPLPGMRRLARHAVLVSCTFSHCVPPQHCTSFQIETDNSPTTSAMTSSHGCCRRVSDRLAEERACACCAGRLMLTHPTLARFALWARVQKGHPLPHASCQPPLPPVHASEPPPSPCSSSAAAAVDPLLLTAPRLPCVVRGAPSITGAASSTPEHHHATITPMSHCPHRRPSSPDRSRARDLALPVHRAPWTPPMKIFPSTGQSPSVPCCTFCAPSPCQSRRCARSACRAWAAPVSRPRVVVGRAGPGHSQRSGRAKQAAACCVAWAACLVSAQKHGIQRISFSVLFWFKFKFKLWKFLSICPEL
jgi:hypothetical protein